MGIKWELWPEIAQILFNVYVLGEMLRLIGPLVNYICHPCYIKFS